MFFVFGSGTLCAPNVFSPEQIHIPGLCMEQEYPCRNNAEDNNGSETKRVTEDQFLVWVREKM